MASVHRHRGRWQVRWRDPERRQRSATFTRKLDADRYAATVETDMARGDYLDPHAGRETVGDLAQRWLAMRGDRARSTQDRDRSLLASLILPRFGQVPVASLKPSAVAEWLAGLDRAAYTRGKALRILWSVLELARGDGAIRVNPAADVKAPPQKPRRQGRALDDVQLAQVIDAAEELDPQTGMIVVLLARCGLRVGEALALRRDDVDLAEATLTVAASMSRREGRRGPKTGAGVRTIPIPVDAAERLAAHLAGQSPIPIGGELFTTSTGRPLRYDTWRARQWAKIRATVGFDVVPHDLRHTCATRLFTVDRWTPAEVQTYLGHADPRTTLRVYVHVNAAGLPTPSTLTGGSLR